MSLIDNIDDDIKWNEFLQHKISSDKLPDKVIKKYEEFIRNKKYKNITQGIKNNNYLFSYPKKVLIGKMGKSKKRIVYMYKEEETYVLKFLSFLLYKYDYLFAPNLYSFRKNTGVKYAIKKIVRHKGIRKMYAYKVDISDYFNSIPINKLIDNLKCDLDDNKLFEFIENLLVNNKVKYNDILIEEEKGIMAGVPIAAFLANYYLKELDLYFYNNNILYARYADDIIVFGNSKEEVEKYRNYIVNVLTSKGLSINKDKEFFYNPKDEIEFLGFSYKNGVIDISSNSFKKIKKKIRRSARGFRRWMIRKNASNEVTLKAINRKFNNKFYGKNENDLTWKYWFFPIINTTKTLKEIDKYLQETERYMVTGKHNKKNYEKVPYDYLKKCNYRSLVHEFYKFKQEKRNS